jgi:hypothetical protein
MDLASSSILDLRKIHKFQIAHKRDKTNFLLTRTGRSQCEEEKIGFSRLGVIWDCEFLRKLSIGDQNVVYLHEAIFQILSKFGIK